MRPTHPRTPHRADAEPAAGDPAQPLPHDAEPAWPPVGFTRIRDVRVGARVAVSADIVDIAACEWDGEPTIEVTVEDATGSLALAFLGRHDLGGIRSARRLLAAGAVVVHRGRLLMLDPYVWALVGGCGGAAHDR
jgi:hypothetical protein